MECGLTRPELLPLSHNIQSIHRKLFEVWVERKAWKKCPNWFFLGLEWFESIYCRASFGILVADKTIIRWGKNNAQAKTWKLTLHQSAQRKIIVFMDLRSSVEQSSCLAIFSGQRRPLGREVRRCNERPAAGLSPPESETSCRNLKFPLTFMRSINKHVLLKP